jgi:anti-anti-sigma factor
MFPDTVLYVDSRPSSHDPRCTAVTVSGPIVLHTAAELRRVLHEALEGDIHRFDVDLSGVTDADPAGLATLVVAARRLQARPDGGSLRLIAISRICADVMRHLHLFHDQLAKLEPKTSTTTPQPTPGPAESEARIRPYSGSRPPGAALKTSAVSSNRLRARRRAVR